MKVLKNTPCPSEIKAGERQEWDGSTVRCTETSPLKGELVGNCKEENRSV